MTDTRAAMMFVILLHKVGEGSWSSRLPSWGPRAPSRCLPGRSPRVEDQLEPAVTVAAHLPLRVETLAVPADAVATLDTPGS